MSTRSLPATEHRLPTPQGYIYAQDYAGEGDAFVVMHGFPDNRHIYDQLIPRLVQAGRRVVAFDFAGFGDSDRKVDGIYSFAQQLEDLRTVVKALDLGKIVPVAHDASGPAALNYALDAPDSVSSICLLNCLYAAGPNIRVPELILLFATAGLKALAMAALNDPQEFAWLLKFQQRKFHDALPEALRMPFLSSVAAIINENFAGDRNSARAFAQMTEALFPEVGRNTARLPELATLDVPVKLIWGQHDPYLNPGVADDLIPHLKAPTLHVLPVGHWPQIDMPDEFARLMTA